MRPFPLIFLICLAGAFVGGALYAPTNYDGITYRLPRIFHWLSEERWHWISTWNGRMNYSATGFEWLMVPAFAIFRTDRLFFLINVISCALLPGLIYSGFTLLGISRRVAWAWMWLLPTGYCFVTQAGSIGNDSFAAVYFLAALVFGLRSWRSRSLFHVFLSLLASGLLTGAKASNIPLLLPIAIVLIPGIWRTLVGPCSLRTPTSARARLPLSTSRSPRPSSFARFSGCKLLFLKLAIVLLCSLLAALVSFAPLAIINIRQTGDWSGDPSNEGKMKLKNPVAGIVGNGLQLAAGCLAPPALPGAGTWNQFAKHLIESPSFSQLHINFPRLSLTLVELPTEEGAGLGLGITSLLIASVLGGICLRPRRIQSRLALLVGLCCWIALGAYMAKLGSECTARLIAAYYPGLIIPVLALAPQARLVTHRWWKGVAILAGLSALIPLALAPPRPLFPVSALLNLAEKAGAPAAILQRAQTVYSVYGDRNDSLAVIRERLPASVKTIGFSGTSDESEISFWMPFGERTVVDLVPVNRKSPPLAGLDCVVGSTWGFNDRFGLTAQQFAEQAGWKIVWSDTIPTRAGSPPPRWFVIIPSGARGEF